MPTPKRDLLPGTLDMLVLKTLTAGPQHGYGIARHIERLSGDVLTVEEGSLYPALQRMRQREWISASWGTTSNKQRARFYTITTSGRKQLGESHSVFTDIVAAIGRVMRTS